MLQPGSRLGKYRIIRCIGTGGFATVYLGEHVYLKTRAAVKVLHVASGMERNETEKFLREARTIAALKHPHIVSILDFGVEDGVPCFIMDYAPNGSLGARHRKEPILDSRTILSYATQVAEALQFAHDHKVVHCDVKPENMLLDQNNNVLLSDFGIAVVWHTNFKMSRVIGTLPYMSPEQLLGNPVAASDQYALAVSIYSWLCGRFPFDGRNPVEMRNLHRWVSPPPLRQINPQIPARVEQVVLTALAKDPRERFSSISAFASALRKAIQPEYALPSLPLSPVLPMQEKPVALDEPLALLPSLFSLLPPVDKTKIQPLPPALSLPVEYAYKPAVPPAREETGHWNDEARSVPDVSTKLLPENSLLSPSVSFSTVPAPEVSVSTHFIYNQHTTWVSAITWSPDGTKLASASWDKTVRVWESASAKTLLVYRGHTEPVKSVAWSPDGRYIASGAWDNSVHVWDAVSGIALPEVYRHKALVETVAWSSDGVYIASAGHDSKVQVWRAADQYSFYTYEGHEGSVWSVAWSPRDKYVASAGHDGTVHVWEALTGKQVQVYRNHDHPVAAVSWSYDGQLIASGDHDGWVHVWSVTDGNTLFQYRDEAGAVKALNWSPLSKHLASAVKSVQIWHVTTPPPTVPSFTYTGHVDWINALSWSPDGEQIATASDDHAVRIEVLRDNLER